jgi:hypothetical protein
VNHSQGTRPKYKIAGEAGVFLGDSPSEAAGKLAAGGAPLTPRHAGAAPGELTWLDSRWWSWSGSAWTPIARATPTMRWGPPVVQAPEVAAWVVSRLARAGHEPLALPMGDGNLYLLNAERGAPVLRAASSYPASVTELAPPPVAEVVTPYTDVRDSMRKMAAQIAHDFRRRRVVEDARQVIHEAQLPDPRGKPNRRAIMWALFHNQKARTTFHDDPQDTELYGSTEAILCLDPDGACLRGGDCDEQIIALGSRGMALGVPIRLRARRYAKQRNLHVVLQFDAARRGDPQWESIDPSTEDGIASEAPFTEEIFQMIDTTPAFVALGAPPDEATLGAPHFDSPKGGYAPAPIAAPAIPPGYEGRGWVLVSESEGELGPFLGLGYTAPIPVQVSAWLEENTPDGTRGAWKQASVSTEPAGAPPRYGTLGELAVQFPDGSRFFYYFGWTGDASSSYRAPVAGPGVLPPTLGADTITPSAPAQTQLDPTTAAAWLSLLAAIQTRFNESLGELQAASASYLQTRTALGLPAIDADGPDTATSTTPLADYVASVSSGNPRWTTAAENAEIKLLAAGSFVSQVLADGLSGARTLTFDSQGTVEGRPDLLIGYEPGDPYSILLVKNPTTGIYTPEFFTPGPTVPSSPLATLGDPSSVTLGLAPVIIGLLIVGGVAVTAVSCWALVHYYDYLRQAKNDDAIGKIAEFTAQGKLTTQEQEQLTNAVTATDSTVSGNPPPGQPTTGSSIATIVQWLAYAAVAVAGVLIVSKVVEAIPSRRRPALEAHSPRAGPRRRRRRARAPVYAEDSTSSYRGATRRREREDFAEQNIPEELVPLWRRERSRFRGSPHERSEAFLEWSETDEGQGAALELAVERGQARVVELTSRCTCKDGSCPHCCGQGCCSWHRGLERDKYGECGVDDEVPF